MLGAKSTCKDRWRQVLAEDEKISRKHLLTLEPGISEPQTHQMGVVARIGCQVLTQAFATTTDMLNAA